MSRRHLINSSDVFVIKGFTVVNLENLINLENLVNLENLENLENLVNLANLENLENLHIELLHFNLEQDQNLILTFQKFAKKSDLLHKYIKSRI